MIRVVPHQRWQIEGRRKARLALGEQIAETRVGVFRRAEARKLAHRPEPCAVHRRMNPAGIRRNAGHTQIAFRIPAIQIRFRVEPANGMAGSGCEIVVALGAFCQCRLKGVLLPGEFFFRGSPMWGGSVSRSEGLRRSFWLIAHSWASLRACGSICGISSTHAMRKV